MGNVLSKRRRGRQHFERSEQPRKSKRRFRSLSLSGRRRGKTYGSIRLKKKSHRKSASVSDRNTPWRMSADNLERESKPGLRTSELVERDKFLDLLSKVQDNRYENQRYTLKAGSATDHEEADDVFEEPRSGMDSTDTIEINGSLPNGQVGTTSPDSMAEPGSSAAMRKAKTISFFPVINVDSTGTVENGHPSSSCTSGSVEGEGLGHDSFSPPEFMVGSMMTPSRKSMEALKKVIASEGPYPMIIEPSGGGYWVENGECESALGEDGIWRAPEISTEHYTIQTDTIANIYGRYFVGQDHINYIANDSNAGPALLSLKFEEDYQGVQARALLRTKNETVYKIIPSSLLPKHMEPEDYFKYISKQHGEEMNVAKAVEITSAKNVQLIQKFDEHTVDKTHKFGVIYQKRGQTSEEELFGNIDHPDALEEFLDMLGEKVKLKGFKGYRGGLDVTNDQTGEYSIHTEYKDREIIFHVSTLLPHDPGDTQHVQKKRHIGNDIVVIVFQDENTPFCPNMVRSHFIHGYIVVQVEHPNTDHTVYKVSMAAKQEVADFGPPIPDPAVFQKGTEFRDWLLTKALNAEFNCHNASDFKKLANRTRNQLFKHLMEELSSTVEEVDHSSQAKHLVLSLQDGGSASQIPRHRRRRRTLTGIFSKSNLKDQSTSSSFLPFPKKKSSISASPKTFRKNFGDTVSPIRAMMVGSTPDLVAATGDQVSNGSPDEDDSQGKSKSRRRFIFKKDSKDKDKKKKPKRTSSVSGPRRKISSPFMKRSHRKRNSSDELSLSSSLNWSVPYDLPGVIEANDEFHSNDFMTNAELRARWRSTPTILERIESDTVLSVHDVEFSFTSTADVAVQVGHHESFERFTSPDSSPSSTVGRPHRPNHHQVNSSPIATRSHPGTPSKSHRAQSYFKIPEGSAPAFRQPSRLVYQNRNRRLLSNERDSPEGKENDELINRAESEESVSTEIDDVYASLLQSLQSLTEEVSQLRDQNLDLCRENVKFACQNERLKIRHNEMKKQLLQAQKLSEALEQKIQLYEPDFVCTGTTV